LGNQTFQGEIEGDKIRHFEIKKMLYPLVQRIYGVKMEEIIQSIDQTHLICVGQEIHGHNGVNERTAHSFVVPRHYGTATQSDYRCLEQMSHRCHTIVGEMFQYYDVVANGGFQQLSDEG